MTEGQLLERKRNEQISQLTDQLSALLPSILARHTFNEESPGDFKAQQMSLHAKIGGKHTRT